MLWQFCWMAAGLAVVAAGSASAHAGPRESQPRLPGYYEGHFVKANGDKTDAQLWIKEVGSQTTTRYGLLLRDGGDGGAQMFRIDDLGDGKQMWMQLFQSADGLLQFGEDATYDGSLFWQDGDARIQLTLTDFGKLIGCEETLELKSEDGDRWADFRMDGKKIKGAHKSKGMIDAQQFNGRVVIEKQAYTGSFRLQSIFPGVVVMHGVGVSQDSVDGHEVQKEITAVVAVIHRHRPILRDKDDYEFVRLNPGQTQCLDSVTKLRTAIIQ